MGLLTILGLKRLEVRALRDGISKEELKELRKKALSSLEPKVTSYNVKENKKEYVSVNVEQTKSKEAVRHDRDDNTKLTKIPRAKMPKKDDKDMEIRR